MKKSYSKLVISIYVVTIFIVYILWSNLFKKIYVANHVGEWEKIQAVLISTSTYTYLPSKVQRFVRYSPRVEYSYRWNDTLYTGNRIGVDEIRFANKEEADDFINKYATKDLLDIYIDPMDPKESIVIKPIISHMSFVYTAIMYSIFSLIIFLLIYATHRNHRKIQQ